MLRQQNTDLLIELSKYTAMSRESLTGPLKSMIRDMREQGLELKKSIFASSAKSIQRLAIVLYASIFLS